MLAVVLFTAATKILLIARPVFESYDITANVQGFLLC
jgi:hypothetical protein